MLTKTEGKIMSVLCAACKDGKSALISPADLLNISGAEIDSSALDKIMNDLSLDGYFDLVYSDRRGEKVYCVTLSERGKGYPRSIKIMKRNVMFRVSLSVLLAVFSFLIGLLLKKIF